MRLLRNTILSDLYTHSSTWSEVLEMHALLEMTSKEIASALNKSPASVRMIMYRARKYLKQKHFITLTDYQILDAKINSKEQKKELRGIIRVSHSLTLNDTF